MFTPYDANRAAVGSHAKAVRLSLLKLGMRRCSLTLVYRQGDPDTDRPSWYCLFIRWFTALWLARREGAELLFEDFLARVAALRDQAEARRGDAPGRLAADLELAEAEHSDIVRARFRGDDLRRLRQEVIEDVAAKRRLVATLTWMLAEDAGSGDARRAA